LEELADKYYLNIDGAKTTARYMTTTFNYTHAGKACHPACVHVDGTARPQLVYQKDNLSFYRIIQKFYEKTGMGSVLNTSFNAHEEPIVSSQKKRLMHFSIVNLMRWRWGHFSLSNDVPNSSGIFLIGKYCRLWAGIGSTRKFRSCVLFSEYSLLIVLVLKSITVVVMPIAHSPKINTYILWANGAII